MNRKLRGAAALLFVGLAAPAGCGGDGPLPPGGPIITITNAWEAGGGRRFLLTSPADDGKNAGTFGGDEIHPTHGQSTVTGSWAAGRVEMTVQRGNPQPRYVATFSSPNPDRLDFTSPNGGGNLTLTRQPPNQ